MARGTLRVYLGAAAGVGKTYAMLNEGQRRLERGADVVVALLETHGRLLSVGRAEATSFNLPFSQEVLADVLGLSVPHLNRVMQQLRADRLITSHSRVVELNDVLSLQTLAQYQPLAWAPIPALAKR